jgi:hypothetical protein
VTAAFTAQPSLDGGQYGQRTTVLGRLSLGENPAERFSPDSLNGGMICPHHLFQIKEENMKSETRTCSLCKKTFTGFGHNPEPILEYDQRCCDECNWNVIVPVRIFGLTNPIAMAALEKVGYQVRTTLEKKHDGAEGTFVLSARARRGS